MRNPDKFRVFVVDDHPLFCEGLAELVNGQSDLVCCGSAGNMREAETAIAGQKPDLVVLDLRLGREDGRELIRVLRSRFAEMPILVVSQLDEGRYAGEVLASGARGYIMKEQATEEVLKAIRTVLAGQVYVSPKATFAAFRRMISFHGPTGPDRLPSLTDREFLVFRSIADAKDNHQIASELALSVKTIENYRERIKFKLRLPDSAALAAFADQWMRQQTPAPSAGLRVPDPSLPVSELRPGA